MWKTNVLRDLVMKNNNQVALDSKIAPIVYESYLPLAAAPWETSRLNMIIKEHRMDP